MPAGHNGYGRGGRVVIKGVPSPLERNGKAFVYKRGPLEGLWLFWGKPPWAPLLKSCNECNAAFPKKLWGTPPTYASGGNAYPRSTNELYKRRCSSVSGEHWGHSVLRLAAWRWQGAAFQKNEQMCHTSTCGHVPNEKTPMSGIVGLCRCWVHPDRLAKPSLSVLALGSFSHAVTHGQAIHNPHTSMPGSEHDTLPQDRRFAH